MFEDDAGATGGKCNTFGFFNFTVLLEGDFDLERCRLERVEIALRGRPTAVAALVARLVYGSLKSN